MRTSYSIAVSCMAMAFGACSTLVFATSGHRPRPPLADEAHRTDLSVPPPPPVAQRDPAKTSTTETLATESPRWPAPLPPSERRDGARWGGEVADRGAPQVNRADIEAAELPRAPVGRWRAYEDSVAPRREPLQPGSQGYPDEPRADPVGRDASERATLTTTALPRGFPDASTPVDERSLRDDDRFELTYYDFPQEGDGTRDTKLYDPSCSVLTTVTRDFHDHLCVQGSGRLASGETVSFARRDCACATRCPRTGQQICFERLDPQRFPHGRGAMGQPITPLRTIAVDPARIPLGKTVFIPALVGLPRADGSPHDGCFVAEDRGLRVRGNKIDVFAGAEPASSPWRTQLVAKSGARVIIEDPRCRAGAGL